MLKACVVESEEESAARSVKLKVPGVVGVPANTPALEIEMPGGTDPETTDQLYGGVPPVAAKDVEKAAPTSPPWTN